MSETRVLPMMLDRTYLEKRDDRNVARGYADIYGDGHLLDVTRWERAEVDGNAAGGIISTTGDLFKFTQALMTGKIISATSLEEMKKIQWQNCQAPECESGLGLELWRTGAGIGYGKNGTTVGTESNVVYFPDSGNMYVIFKNNGIGSDKTFLDEIMKQ